MIQIKSGPSASLRDLGLGRPHSGQPTSVRHTRTCAVHCAVLRGLFFCVLPAKEVQLEITRWLAFSVVAPTLSNSLRTDARLAPSTMTLWHLVKTELFRQAAIFSSRLSYPTFLDFRSLECIYLSLVGNIVLISLCRERFDCSSASIYVSAALEWPLGQET